MRKRHSKGGLTVNAIAGAHVVLLGWTIEDAGRANLRGFAVRRTDQAEEETYWDFVAWTAGAAAGVG